MKMITYTSGKLPKGKLIQGKKYKVELEYEKGYLIINEMDIITYYEKKHFTDIDLLRKFKIEKLLKLFKKNDN